jgi:hypothetical protein
MYTRVLSELMYWPSSFISFNCVYMSISVAYPAQRFIKASSFFLSSPFSLSLSLSLSLSSALCAWVFSLSFCICFFSLVLCLYMLLDSHVFPDLDTTILVSYGSRGAPKDHSIGFIFLLFDLCLLNMHRHNIA